MSTAQAPNGRTEEPKRVAISHAPTPPESGEKKRSPAPLLLTMTLALVAAFSLSAGQALAASVRPEDSTITITAETQTFTYASQISFQVQASDIAGKINKAELEISVPQVGIDHQVNVPVSQPGVSIALTYRYDPSNDYFPPYTPITYHWTLSDNAHHTLTGDDQHFDFADTRFSWQHLTQNDISVYWYNQDTAYGQDILDTAVKEAASIEQDLNGTLTVPIRVLVYASNDDLHGGLPSDSPNWAGGVALIPFYEALIVVGDQQYPLQRDLPHELTHLILHEVAGLDCGGCPLWFDEGMAVYHQLYHEPEMQFAFDNAVQDRKLLTFHSIYQRFPQDSDQAEIAYAQSWNYIKYLYRTYSQPKMAQLVDALPKTAFASAFQQAFGLSPDQMENQWRTSLGLDPISNPNSTPAAGKTPTGSQSAGEPVEGNSNGILMALAIVVFLLLAAGLVGALFVMRRSKPVPDTGAGASWPMPSAGPPITAAPTQRPGYQPGYSPMPPPQNMPIEQQYQWQIEQRQALRRSIEDSVGIEKRLQIQQAEIERQIEQYAAQERQARDEGSENRAMLALDRRQKLETQIPYIQQQLAQVRMQRLDALQRDRQLSADVDAALRQRAMLAHQVVPVHAWSQPNGAMPPPKRPVSQE